MKGLVSIILPIYKVEDSLEKCVDSVLNQTYKNLEVILVDDGSPDNCPKICDELAKKDNRIRVIHKQNGGLSSARNSGLDVMTGDFVAFVDSDDYVEPEYVETMLNVIERDGSDMVVCGVKKVDTNGNEIPESAFTFENQIVSQENKFSLLFPQKKLYAVVAWNKLYRAYIWKNLRYVEGRIHEDEFAIYDLLSEIKGQISLESKVLYNYVVRESSIMGDRAPKPQMLDGIYCGRYRLSKVGKNSPYFKDALIQLLDCYIYIYLKIKTDKKLLKEWKKLFDEDRKIYLKFLNKKQKFKFFVVRFIPWIIELSYNLKK